MPLLRIGEVWGGGGGVGVKETGREMEFNEPERQKLGKDKVSTWAS